MTRWWHRGSLRFRLALWYGACSTVLLSAFSLTLYLFVENRVAPPLDEELRADLATLRQRLAMAPDGTLRWDGERIGPGTQWEAGDPWFELWTGERQLIGRFWTLNDADLDRLPAPPVPGRETLSVFSVDPGVRLRVLSVPYPDPAATAGPTLRVMRIHEASTDAVRALGLIIVAALPVVIALLVAGGYLITRHWLEPLRAMVAASERITARDLGRRLPIANPDDELGRLAAAFNLTLARLEDSFTALDRFVGDASHELRTPLTTLRSVGEVALRKDRPAEEYREVIGSMLEEAQRLQNLVQRLLELATAEGGASVAQAQDVAVAELLRTCVADLEIIAEQKGQSFAVDVEAGGVRTDPLLLRQALLNLLENALKYGPQGSAIRLVARRDGEALTIAVTDAGPGIAPEHRARIAERFFRADAGRGRMTGGVGLGLALTKAYLRVLGGSLDYEAPTGGGARFLLTIPDLPRA